MTLMLACGRCRRLVVASTIEVSDVNDDCTGAADVGEGVLTLLLEKDVCHMSAVVRTFSGGSVVCSCCSGRGRGRCSVWK